LGRRNPSYSTADTSFAPIPLKQHAVPSGAVEILANSRSQGEFELLVNSPNFPINNRGGDDEGAKNLSASLYGPNDGCVLRQGDVMDGVIA
jgi:hypothetical protein